jgi:hypothetical protein
LTVFMLCSNAVSIEMFSYHVFTQMAALCSKVRYLKDTDVTQFTVVTEKGWKKIKIGKG